TAAISTVLLSIFSIDIYCTTPDLHSFPTRRSSDLPKDYGDLLHNLALARLHINGPERASELFLHAYERNQRQESLIQYLYCIWLDRKSTRLNSSHVKISYAVFCLKKKKSLNIITNS